MTLSGKVGKKTHQYSIELLDQVGLGDRMSHHLEELSGGEQQRVAVAIAFPTGRACFWLTNQPVNWILPLRKRSMIYFATSTGNWV